LVLKYVPVSADGYLILPVCRSALPLFKRKKKSTEQELQDGGGVAVNGDEDNADELQDDDSGNAEAQDSQDQKADDHAVRGSDDSGSDGDGDNTDDVAQSNEDDDAEDDGKKKKKKKEKPDKNLFLSDPKKARRFFEHAETVAETRNYDYAIECYINGLHHDPDNMIRHEALREIALKRKVSGGKPAKFAEKLKMKAKTKIDKVLRSEALWSKDPLSLQRSMELMKIAVEADELHDNLNFGELAYWVGQLIMEKNETQKPPNKADMLKIRDLFSAVGAWQESVDTTRKAMMLDPNDTELADELKDLEAELAMAKGNYATDSRDALRDKEEQDALADEDQLTKSEDTSDRIIQRRRVELTQKPDDDDLRIKLVRALAERDSEETENEAITILNEMYKKSNNPRHKLAIGDIRIKQMSRGLRQLRKQRNQDKKNTELVDQYKQLAKKRLEFELIEYTERVKNYPTDRKWRFELAKRLFQVKRYDDAITNFQVSKEDPKYRVASHNYLGRCYLTQKWFDEAIETLKTGLEGEADMTSDLALEMQWYLMMALMQSAAENKSLELAKEAQKVASQILQTDINYKNIKDVIEKVRDAVKKLQSRDAK